MSQKTNIENDVSVAQENTTMFQSTYIRVDSCEILFKCFPLLLDTL